MTGDVERISVDDVIKAFKAEYPDYMSFMSDVIKNPVTNSNLPLDSQIQQTKKRKFSIDFQFGNYSVPTPINGYGIANNIVEQGKYFASVNQDNQFLYNQISQAEKDAQTGNYQANPSPEIHLLDMTLDSVIRNYSRFTAKRVEESNENLADGGGEYSELRKVELTFTDEFTAATNGRYKTMRLKQVMNQSTGRLAIDMEFRNEKGNLVTPTDEKIGKPLELTLYNLFNEYHTMH